MRQTELTLAPLELLDRLAALIPPPRRHRHHYAGVFAPHASLRARAPPEFDAGLAFGFDQRTPARSSFDQTLN